MFDRSLLSEGGAAGHMNHLYDNGNLTFDKLKEIFSAASSGQLIGTEKTDGQNLMISYSVKEHSAKGARNTGDIKTGGMDPVQLATKFAAHANQNLKSTFSDALRIFEKAIQRLDKEQQIELFGDNTNIFYNAEIMDPRAPNVIQYDTKTLVIHRVGHKYRDDATGYIYPLKKIQTPEEEKGSKEAENILAANFIKLEEIIKSAQQDLKQEEYGLQTNAIKSLEAISDKSVLNKALSNLDKIIADANSDTNNSFNLRSSSDINSFMLARVTHIVNSMLNDAKADIGEVPAVVKMNIVKRICGIGEIRLIDLKKSIENKEQKLFISEKLLSEPATLKILKTAILPLEILVSNFASEMLRGVNSAYIIDNKKELSRIKQDVSNAVRNIKAANNDNLMQTLKHQLSKLKSVDDISATVEGFVFDYDGVTYKFTGDFAPVNQILGIFKYSDDFKKTGQSQQPVEAIKEESDEAKSQIEKIICIYPGRFQPMGRHHVMAYQQLVNKFGERNVFIATSNKVDLPKSPLSYEEKKAVMIRHGIPASQIVQTKNPYQALEIVTKFNPETTAVSFAVGEKDMKEDPRFKITGKYFEMYPDNTNKMVGYRNHGYLYVIPHMESKVVTKDDSGKKITLNISSGTEIRQYLADGDHAIFAALMGTEDEALYQFLTNKFKEAKSVIKEYTLDDIIVDVWESI